MSDKPTSGAMPVFLVVDDRREGRTLLSRLLQYQFADARIIEAVNGEEAIKFAT